MKVKNFLTNKLQILKKYTFDESKKKNQQIANIKNYKVDESKMVCNQQIANIKNYKVHESKKFITNKLQILKNIRLMKVKML